MLHVYSQRMARQDAKLKNCREQHPALQQELVKAKQNFREEALETMDEHEVEEEIQKAQECSSDVPLLKTIYLARRAVVDNDDAIAKAEQLMAQNRQEKSKHRKDIASLKAERKRELDKVLIRLSKGISKVHTHGQKFTFVYTLRNFVQIANKATELKVLKTELTSLAYRAQFLTQQNIDELKQTCDEALGTSRQLESFAKKVHNFTCRATVDIFADVTLLIHVTISLQLTDLEDTKEKLGEFLKHLDVRHKSYN